MEPFRFAFRLASFGIFNRFDSAIHKGLIEMHTRINSSWSHSSNRFQKRDQTAFTLSARFSSILNSCDSPLSCDFPKCFTERIFRISFSVLRSQYAAVLQPRALVASVSRHSHTISAASLFHPRESRILRVFLASHCSLPLYFLLYSILLFFRTECKICNSILYTGR